MPQRPWLWVCLTCLDYCNSVLYGIADNLLQRLQSVQKAAMQLVSGVRQRDHFSPILHERHKMASSAKACWVQVSSIDVQVADTAILDWLPACCRRRSPSSLLGWHTATQSQALVSGRFMQSVLNYGRSTSPAPSAGGRTRQFKQHFCFILLTYFT